MLALYVRNVAFATGAHSKIPICLMASFAITVLRLGDSHSIAPCFSFVWSLWPSITKSFTHALHGPASILGTVITRSDGSILPDVNRKGIGAIVPTRVVGNPPIVSRKFLTSNVFVTVGSVMSALSPGRSAAPPTDSTTVNEPSSLLEPSARGKASSTIFALLKSRYDTARLTSLSSIIVPFLASELPANAAVTQFRIGA